MSERELYFQNTKTGEISGRVDVSGRSQREVDRCIRGMLINKHDDWLVRDTRYSPLPPSHSETP
jgi:hypothetical protein